MKTLLTLSLLLIFISSGFTQNYKKYYKEKLEHDSRVITSGRNFTIEKTKSKIFVFKQYYPKTKMITKVISSKNRKFTELHGLQQVNYDDGTIVTKGHYLNGEKNGTWIEKIHYEGEYVNGQKQGIWKSLNAKNFTNETIEYVDNMIHGSRIVYDSLENIKYQEVYQSDSLISSTVDSTIIQPVSEELPRFLGCEDQGLSARELKMCSNKILLQYIYSNIKYPKQARKDDIEGTAIIQFVVDSTGHVQDIKPLSGICEEIESHCVEIIQNMPRWRPGMQDGKPVKVLYTLPIKFGLH